jgi:hypothetical protein
MATIKNPELCDVIGEVGGCTQRRGGVPPLARPGHQAVRLGQSRRTSFSESRRVRHFTATLDHMSFGGEPHFCVGAQLARVDLRLLFDEFFTRVVRCEPAGEPVCLRSHQLTSRTGVRCPEWDCSSRPMVRSTISVDVQPAEPAARGMSRSS